MINLENLDPISDSQKLIIRRLCVLQLDSLKRLLDNEPHDEKDVILFLIQENVDITVFNEHLEECIEKIKEVHDDPSNLRKLTPDDLSMFRHMLTHIEDEYKDTYPNAVKNLWSRLFTIEKIPDNQLHLNN